ncbi:MAG: hypothetical protein JKY71_09940 [Alphaproteobacteria bacterium]|nr:hypothetical protein [Alphaproteobacteria bacterium]
MKHLLTAVLGLTVFISAPAFAETCDQGLIDKNVKHVHQNIDKIPEGQQAMAQIQNSIDQGNLDPKDKDRAMKVYLEIAIRNANNCAVSEELQREALGLFNSNKAGTKTCRNNMFLKEANSEFAEIKAMPDYAAFEGQAKQKIQQNMSPQVQASFSQKWEASPALREKLIIASIQAGMRKSEGCKNVALPVAPLITEFAQ